MNDGREDMALPAGMTCGVCENWYRCRNLICTLDPEATTCDFSPSRFRACQNAVTIRDLKAEVDDANRRARDAQERLAMSGEVIDRLRDRWWELRQRLEEMHRCPRGRNLVMGTWERAIEAVQREMDEVDRSAVARARMVAGAMDYSSKNGG